MRLCHASFRSRLTDKFLRQVKGTLQIRRKVIEVIVDWRTRQPDKKRRRQGSRHPTRIKHWQCEWMGGRMVLPDTTTGHLGRWPVLTSWNNQWTNWARHWPNKTKPDFGLLEASWYVPLHWNQENAQCNVCRIEVVGRVVVNSAELKSRWCHECLQRYKRWNHDCTSQKERN